MTSALHSRTLEWLETLRARLREERTTREVIWSLPFHRDREGLRSSLQVQLWVERQVRLAYHRDSLGCFPVRPREEVAHA